MTCGNYDSQNFAKYTTRDTYIEFAQQGVQVQQVAAMQRVDTTHIQHRAQHV